VQKALGEVFNRAVDGGGNVGTEMRENFAPEEIVPRGTFLVLASILRSGSDFVPRGTLETREIRMKNVGHCSTWNNFQ
jgi:hypothetical protein